MERTEQIKKLLPLYNDATIAKHIGVSREWIRVVRKREGNISNPYRHQRCSIISESGLAFIMKSYKTLTNKEIAKSLNCSQRTVINLKRKHKLKSQFIPKKYKLELLITLLETKLSICKIARFLGIHYIALHKNIRKLRRLGLIPMTRQHSRNTLKKEKNYGRL